MAGREGIATANKANLINSGQARVSWKQDRAHRDDAEKANAALRFLNHSKHIYVKVFVSKLEMMQPWQNN